MNKILFVLLFAGISFGAVQEASAGKTLKNENENNTKGVKLPKKKAPQRVDFNNPQKALQEISKNIQRRSFPRKANLENKPRPQRLFWEIAKQLEESSSKK